MRLLIMEPIHPAGVDWLRERGITPLYAYEGDDWRAVSNQIVAVVVRSHKVTADFLDQLPALKIVGKYGVGVNTIDLGATAARDVVVTNVLTANTNAVAEHGVAMLLAAARDLVVCDAMTRDDRFDERHGIRLMKEISGASIGVIGFGRIGTRIAAILRRGFACRIGVYDPFVPPEAVEGADAAVFDDVSDLMRWADHVMVAAPQTPQTLDLVGDDELALLGRDGIVVCSSRGGIVNEHALARAAGSRVIRGAAVDVFWPEPPRRDNPLYALDNVVVTPHVGGHTDRSREKLSIDVCEQIWALLNGGDAPIAGAEKWLRA